MTPGDPSWPSADELLALVTKLGIGDITESEAVTLYLFSPFRIRLPSGLVMHFRSSLDAVLDDVRAVVGRDPTGAIVHSDLSRRWHGSIGYLVLIDQLSKALAVPHEVEGGNGFERWLVWDGTVLSDEAAAIYALRCSFVHQYGLLNVGQGRTDERKAELTHLFALTATGGDLVRLGDRRNVPTDPAQLHTMGTTYVDLMSLGNVAESLVANLRRVHRVDGLHLRADVALPTFLRQSFFQHADPMTPDGVAPTRTSTSLP